MKSHEKLIQLDTRAQKYKLLKSYKEQVVILFTWVYKRMCTVYLGELIEAEYFLNWNLAQPFLFNSYLQKNLLAIYNY